MEAEVKNALFVAAFILFFILGLAAHVDSFEMPPCPSDNANILVGEEGEERFVRVQKGMVSSAYWSVSLEKVKEAAKKAGKSFDENQCPPADGTLRYPYYKRHNGMIIMFKAEIKLPQGFFDNRDNWLNDQETSDYIKQKEIEEGAEPI